jgi:predicted transposase YbfD/YdcC
MPCIPNTKRPDTWSRKTKADYVLTVKDNQPILKTHIEDLHLNDAPPHDQTTDKGHGRIEVRSIWVSEELNDYLEFPSLRQVFCLRREVMNLGKNKESSETVYSITRLPSAQASPQRILALNRGQWSIENRLHWVRDVTFDGDRSQIRTGAGPRVMAPLRNLVISILVDAVRRTLQRPSGGLRSRPSSRSGSGSLVCSIYSASPETVTR